MDKDKNTTNADSVDNDKKYDGKKDQYGGTMTGTGYGRQAEESKEKTEKPSIDDTVVSPENEKDYDENESSNGIHTEPNQRSGYNKNSNKNK